MLRSEGGCASFSDCATCERRLTRRKASRRATNAAFQAATSPPNGEETPKLCGYTGLCPRVYQSGGKDRRGALSHAGPKYLRWALMEAATTACRHPIYRERYVRNKRRLGKQRGAKVAQVDIARRLAEAIWHMLTRSQPFAPAGANRT